MTVPVRVERAGVAWRAVVLLTAAVVGVVALYGVGVLLPYFANGLHRLPLSEVAGGGHNPKDLWPQGDAGGRLRLSGILALALTPVTLVFVAVGSGWLLVRGVLPGRPRRSVLPLVALSILTVACIVGLVWFTGPTSSSLAAWMMD